MRAVLRRAVGGFFANDCPLAAAAIAYYVLLSIFPLVLIVIIPAAVQAVPGLASNI